MNMISTIGEKHTNDMHQGKASWPKIAKLALIGLTAVGMASCLGTYTGGGSIDSAAGAPHKATFGFMIEATEPDAFVEPTVAEWQFQYNDQAAGVRFHVAEMEPAYYAELIDTFPQAYIQIYTGVYTSPAGKGLVDFGMGSDQQDGNSDAVSVRVLTGPYAGYFNKGLVKNGNIQFKPIE